jgi:hypothetical protein
MQASQRSSRQLIEALAPTANLFLLVTLPELRNQGLTFLAFYVLQRIVEEVELTSDRSGSRPGFRTMKSAGHADY